MNQGTGLRAAAAAAALLAGGNAWAAGGHHAVDDAIIASRGECEQETWLTGDRAGGRALHAGVSCRLGPLELGIAGEHARADGQSGTAWEAQAKWAREIADGLHLGFSVQPQLQPRQRPRYAATTFAALASWTPGVDLAFHLNLGRDFGHGGPDAARSGVAAEWAPLARWWLVAERHVEERTHFLRAGVRWAAGRNWSVDFSRGHRISGPNPSTWTLGVTIELGDAD
jgi:hypothetical protein